MRAGFGAAPPRRPDEREAGGLAGRRGTFAVALAACVLLALVIRLHGLGGHGFWGDEIASWTFATLSPAELLGPVLRVEPNPPAYYLLLKLLVGPLGESDGAMRLPSAVAAALAVAPVALVARRDFGPSAGLWAGLLLAVSASQIHLAQQARSYALLFLAAAVALLLLDILLQRRIRPARRAAAAGGFALSALAMPYLHVTGVFAVAALLVHGAVVLLLRRAWTAEANGAAWLALIGAGIAVALGMLPWLGIVMAVAEDPSNAVRWIERATLSETWRILVNLLGGAFLGRLKLVAGLFALALLAAAAVLGWRQRRPEVIGCLAAFAVGFLALHLASLAQPVLLDRTALALLVFAMPPLGFVLAALRPRWLGLALGVALLALGLRATVERAQLMAREGHREDWAGAVAALAAQAAPGEVVLVLAAPDAGAIPHYAPGLERRLAVRILVQPNSRLDATLAGLLPYARALAPGEGCGGPIWTLARETRWELEGLEGWPPPGGAAQVFGHVKLRRRAPPC